MRLVRRGSDLLEYGGGGELKRIGIPLVIAGLVFGLVPVPLYLAGLHPTVFMLAVPGLALLLPAVWALTYRRAIILDRAASELRVSAGSLFGKSREQIPFDRIREIGILHPSDAPRGSRTVHRRCSVEFRLEDGGRVELHDEAFNEDERQARERASELAEFCGVKVSGRGSS